MWWRRGATQQTLTAMIAQRDQRQGQQVSRILAPVVFSNKTQKSAPSEVSKVSITARDFSLNKTKTLEKILESTAIKNWELHHANIKGGKCHSLMVKFSPYMYRAVTCSVFNKMGTEGWRIDGDEGRFRVNNVDKFTDNNGSLYQLNFDIFHEKINRNGMTELIFKVKSHLYLTKSAMHLQGPAAQEAWDKLVRPLIEAESVELGYDLESITSGLKPLLVEAIKKSKGEENKKRCCVCQGVVVRDIRQCRQCTKTAHTHCMAAMGACKSCAGLQELPPPSPGSEALLTGRIQLADRSGNRTVLTRSPRPPAAQALATGGDTLEASPVIRSPRPPAAQGLAMGDDLLGASPVIKPVRARTPPRPHAALGGPTGSLGSLGGPSVAPETVCPVPVLSVTPPRPPAALGGLTGDTSQAGRPLTVSNDLPGTQTDSEVVTSVSGRHRGSLARDILTVQGPAQTDSDIPAQLQPRAAQGGHPVTSLGGPLAMQVCVTPQPSAATGRALGASVTSPARGRGATGRGRGARGRQPTFSASRALRDGEMEELAVKNSLLHDECEQLRKLNDEYRRRDLTRQTEGQRTGRLGGSETPTIFNNNTVTVGSCGKCEQRTSVKSSVVRGSGPVSEIEEEDTWSEPESDQEAGPHESRAPRVHESQ